MGVIMKHAEQKYEHKHVGEWRIPSIAAAMLIVLVVGGASWTLWRWAQRPGVASDAVAVDGPGRGQGRRAGVEQPPGRVFKRDDSIRAFSGNFWLTLSLPSREMTLRCASGNEWLNPEQQLLLRISQRWSRGASTLRGMQFTDEQKEQMKLVGAEPPLPLAETERARLDGLIRAWESASDAARPEAQRAVLLALREIAGANLSAGRNAFVANVNKLGTIITPPQLDQYRQLETARRGGNRPAPSGRGA